MLFGASQSTQPSPWPTGIWIWDGLGSDASWAPAEATENQLMGEARGPSGSSPASSSETESTSVFPASSKLSTFSPWLLLLL